MKDYYTVDDLAKELGVTTRTIRNYQKSHVIEGIKVAGQWRFSRESVKSLLGETFTDPLLTFNHKRAEKTHSESLLAIDVAISSDTALRNQTQQIIKQYNLLYSGETRQFFYEKINDQLARYTLVGPLKYVLTFGQWIEAFLEENASHD
ncbi:helix-turn-helix domain-containing protein [Enterococcus sp. RIT-PI-f]|uniref:helix-turn-helix domain-containing protein n=1 Tax=Enterococcus sp. RIT-PI-f TaxID=1690244 RepID=UPI0006B9274D|nr:helix-turn-helix domain-containing protein [Enterococcus sp. RIT-PI-f]KPG69520.1 excisionase [Enterococcus sp. RIT-PI-f]